MLQGARMLRGAGDVARSVDYSKFKNSGCVVLAAGLYQGGRKFGTIDGIGKLLGFQAEGSIPLIFFPLCAFLRAVEVTGGIESHTRLIGIYS